MSHAGRELRDPGDRLKGANMKTYPSSGSSSPRRGVMDPRSTTPPIPRDAKALLTDRRSTR
jgi:hypothetical protein